MHAMCVHDLDDDGSTLDIRSAYIDVVLRYMCVHIIMFMAYVRMYTCMYTSCVYTCMYTHRVDNGSVGPWILNSEK